MGLSPYEGPSIRDSASPSTVYRLPSTRRDRRSGLVLLVVLSLLALFTLLAISFVLLASSARVGAVAHVRIEQQTAAPPRLLLDAGVGQVIVGSNNPLSVIGPHSLLEDKFGPPLRGRVSAVWPTLSHVAQGQMVVFEVRFDEPVQQINGYYVGRLLTLTGGPAAQRTRRLTGFYPNLNDPYNAKVRVMSLDGYLPNIGDPLIINGLEFSGMGFGYNPLTFVSPPTAPVPDGLLDYPGDFGPDGGPGDANVNDDDPFNLDPNNFTDDVREAGWSGTDDLPLPQPIALFPNPTTPEYQSYLRGLDGYAGVNPATGLDDNHVFANEDYDVADFQNMLLAAVTPQYGPDGQPGIAGVNDDFDLLNPDTVPVDDWREIGWPGSDDGTGFSVRVPSLHRPALVNYWLSRELTNPSGRVEFRLLRSLFTRDPALFNGAQRPRYERAAHIARKFILRPLPFDHFQDKNNNGVLDIDQNTGLLEPHFTGSNRFWDLNDPSTNSNWAFNATSPLPFAQLPPIAGPWDVDNDGDGAPDSIWVDLGQPVHTTADGRQFKPLYAILCVDMDGRLNLNAHGGSQHIYFTGPNPRFRSSPRDAMQGALSPDFPAGRPPLAGHPFSALLSFGQGYGVAEINPAVLFASSTEYANLLWGAVVPGSVARAIPGKYGEPHERVAGNLPFAGVTGLDDNVYRPPTELAPLNRALPWTGDVMHYGLTGPYGSLADVNGLAALGLDPRGQPLWIARDSLGNWGVLNPTIAGQDDSYELDLSRDARRTWQTPLGVFEIDAPFEPEELERLLRYYDVDSPSLPDRLPQLAPQTTFNPLMRGLVTTESWDTPSPAVVVPPELRLALQELYLMGFGAHPGKATLVDLLKARVWLTLGKPPLPNAQSLNGRISMLLSNQRVQSNNRRGALVRELFAPELISGLRFDLNRPFGNNSDDNNNGVVDEPFEAAAELLWNISQTDNNGDGFHEPYDRTPPDLSTPNLTWPAQDQMSRQRFAKQLFVLAMLLVPDEYLDRDDPNDEFQGENTINTFDKKRELRIRRIAQWAVNVVDYRDRDNIMTPFEYDANPFNGDGWDVDGDLRTENDTPDRRVVWGAEYPDLLLTETINGHDRRTKDLPNDDGQARRRGDSNMDGTADDDDFDQERVPEGWSFVELYCTRNPNNPHLSGDLYSLDPDPRLRGALDLGKMAPPKVASGPQYPVWRMAVTGSKLEGQENDVAANFAQYPLSYSFQPDRPTLFPQGMANASAGDPMDIDRIVWFTTTPPPGGYNDKDKVYYNRNWDPNDPVVPLPPGHYAVVGPARKVNTAANMEFITKIGDGDGTGAGIPPQRLDVNDVGGNGPMFSFRDNNNGNTATYPVGQIKEPLGIGVGADVLLATVPDGRVAGFSISEPAADSYYPQPHVRDPLRGIYKYGPLAGVMPVPRDRPLDSDTGANDTPLFDDGVLGSATYLQYKTVLLQRLANPLLPWNPPQKLPDGTDDPNHDPTWEVNPYLTIDWMPMDLTVYNGEDRAPMDDGTPASMGDPDDPAGATAGDGAIMFSARQRGSTDPQLVGNIWKPVSIDPDDMVNPPWNGTLPWTPMPVSNPNQTAHLFRHLLDHTLGYLNYPFHDPSGNMNPPFYGDQNNPNVNPYYDATAGRDPWDANKQVYAGDPSVKPFPWLTWPNRPLVSHTELLNVPASAPTRLLHEWTEVDKADPYGTAMPVSPYRHLLNFFQSAEAGKAMNDASGIHQLLEYVHVPSRYSGTEMMLRPDVFNTGSGTDPQGSLYPYYAPFNRFSRYRDPGRVNINTIYDNIPIVGSNQGRSLTFRGLVDSTQDQPLGDPIDDLWNELWRSRKGFANIEMAQKDMFELNPLFPTFFANPFRSPASGYYVPVEELRSRSFSPDPLTGGFMPSEPRRLAEAGLLRPNSDPMKKDEPLLALDATETYLDSDRNPYFRHQAYTKLGNLVTTRSNVYAIWITVGFFEVHRVPVDVAHPDGYVLGQELGFDTGETRRHRAFYLYDRTIPVAAERGESHNTHEGFLIRRFIE